MKTVEKRTIKIESREHLLSTLAEAAELEHNLMCLYLYAVFSLKQSMDEGLAEAELQRIGRWRKIIMEVSVQEMTHLALVANLTTAIGGSAHFHRPRFPVKPGYFPDEFVVELAPFSLATLDHFIFLERPEDEAIEDSEEFEPETNYERGAPRGRLMAHSGDYETVGQLYRAIEKGIQFLCEKLGEKSLFCGSQDLQLAPPELDLEGLIQINDQKSALQAIRTIVEQGEGARSCEGSHFEKFQSIRTELVEILQAQPKFEPARPAARNPVMRKSIDPDKELWIEHPVSALYLDLGNALYSVMLRFLLQVYSMEGRSLKDKKLFLESAFSLMHALGVVGSHLSRMPATSNEKDGNAGLSFSLNRHFNAVELSKEKMILTERLNEICSFVQRLKKTDSGSGSQPVIVQVEKILEKILSSFKG